MLISIVWKGSTEKNCSEHIYVHFMVEATKEKEKKEVKEKFIWNAFEFSHSGISVI